jgi:hypothetical protein
LTLAHGLLAAMDRREVVLVHPIPESRKESDPADR